MATKRTIASIIKESFLEINVMKIMPNRTDRICLINSAKVVLKVSVRREIFEDTLL